MLKNVIPKKSVFVEILSGEEGGGLTQIKNVEILISACVWKFSRGGGGGG